MIAGDLELEVINDIAVYGQRTLLWVKERKGGFEDQHLLYRPGFTIVVKSGLSLIKRSLLPDTLRADAVNFAIECELCAQVFFSVNKIERGGKARKGEFVEVK